MCGLVFQVLYITHEAVNRSDSTYKRTATALTLVNIILRSPDQDDKQVVRSHKLALTNRLKD